MHMLVQAIADKTFANLKGGPSSLALDLDDELETASAASAASNFPSSSQPDSLASLAHSASNASPSKAKPVVEEAPQPEPVKKSPAEIKAENGSNA